MAVVTTKLPLCPSIRAELGTSGSDTFVIGSTGDMTDRFEQVEGAARRHMEHRHDWAGGLSRGEAIRMMHDGDLSKVAKSDALLARYEELVPMTRRMATIGAVAGGAPNIGAHLAGSPVAMRRRVRLSSEAGPLCVVVDTTSSAGVSDDQLQRRGAAILAFVRLLSGMRPVTLYVGCSMGIRGTTHNAHCYAAIDTSPLDLARAAHILTSNSFSRQLTYNLGMELGGNGQQITWPNKGRQNVLKEHAKECFERVIAMDEILFVPSIYLLDDLVNDPEKWLTEQVRRYGHGIDAEAAA